MIEKSAPPKASKGQEVTSTRPDGSDAKTLGAVLLVLGILLGIGGEFISPTEYPWSDEIDPDKVILKARLATSGNGLFITGLLIYLAGYIVNAISFLPLKDCE